MDCTELDEVEARLPDDPATLSIDELRSLRNDLQRAESGLSYVRRVLQGRLDIVADERRRRDDPQAGSDSADEPTSDDEAPGDDRSDDLVSSLAATLTRNTHSGGGNRPPQDLAPPSFADELLATYDAGSPHDTGEVADLSGEALVELLESLAAAEAEVSNRRRHLHGAIDDLQAETIRRYRDGESSVNDLLT